MAEDSWDEPMREYVVVVTHTYRVQATDKDDAIDRVSDDMRDLADIEYRAEEAGGA